jgi:phage gpG-like protein
MSKGFKLDKSKLMQAAAVEVQSFVRDNFRSESFGGQKWKRRKSRDRSDRNNPGARRRLLTKTRRMERGLRAVASGTKIVLLTDVEYAKIHNEGGTIAHPGGTPYISVGNAGGRRTRIESMGEAQVTFLKKDGNYPEGTKFTEPHDIPIPQRQFFGDSPELRKRLEKALIASMKRQLKA